MAMGPPPISGVRRHGSVTACLGSSSGSFFSVPPPRIPPLAGGHPPGDPVGGGAAVEGEVAPFEEAGEAFEDAAAAVGLAAVAGGAAGRGGEVVLDLEDELPAHPVEGDAQRRRRSRPAVADGIDQHLAEEEAEASAHRTGEPEFLWPVHLYRE